MKVIGLRTDDNTGCQYIAIEDADSREFRVYNILKCQYENIPDSLYVKVRSIDAFGKIRFSQDEGRLYQEHYKKGKLYSFEVIGTGEDYNTKAPFYLLQDDFSSTHRYYFKGEGKYKFGDDCILEIDGFTNNGFLKFKEVKHYSQDNIEKPIEEKIDNKTRKSWPSSLSGLPTLNIGNENDTVEFKSSLAFPPDTNGEANIEKQLFNILKELTAFMNTKGGTLFIGIHDKTKKVIGIEEDFEHLNDGEEDEYAGSYKKDTDGYELKIRNTIDRLCPALANSLTTIEFPTIEGKTYCKITTTKAQRPIFLAGNQLYVRQGNRLKLLKADEITFFVYNLMSISVKSIIDIDDLNTTASALDIDSIRSVVKEILNERHVSNAIIPKPRDLDEIDYWIVWYNDSSWKRQREKSSDSDLYIQVPVYKNYNDPVLAFCYPSGKVSTIELSKFRRGANLNVLQQAGWSKTEDKPKNIFLMLRTDYLVGYSVDHNGLEYVKLHSISDYPPTAKATNQGYPYIPEGLNVTTYGVLGAEHKRSVEHLVVLKKDRSRNPGTPLNSISMQEEINFLKNAITQ